MTAVEDEADAPSKTAGITSPGATETLKLVLLFFGGVDSGDGGASVVTASE